MDILDLLEKGVKAEELKKAGELLRAYLFDGQPLTEEWWKLDCHARNAARKLAQESADKVLEGVNQDA